jgi:4a-hydroxytetrahydrobiopterin dehydratase
MAATIAREKCVACREDSPKVTQEEMAELKPQVPEWQLMERNSIPQLERVFRVKDFASAMAFAGTVAQRADEVDHHPKLTVEWGRVTVTWWTHKIRGLHRNDFIMAAQTDDLFDGFAKAHPEAVETRRRRREGATT